MPKQLSSAASDTLPAPMFVYDALGNQSVYMACLGYDGYFKCF
jgi:hypothetical protein